MDEGILTGVITAVVLGGIFLILYISSKSKKNKKNKG